MGIDDEGHGHEAPPGGHVREIRDPELVRARRREIALDEVLRAMRQRLHDRGADATALDDTAQAQPTKEPGHGAPGDDDRFTPQLFPRLAGAVPRPGRGPDALDRQAEATSRWARADWRDGSRSRAYCS